MEVVAFMAPKGTADQNPLTSQLVFAVMKLILLWLICFAVMNLFCRDEFGFAVTDLLLPWWLFNCRDVVIGFVFTVVVWFLQ